MGKEFIMAVISVLLSIVAAFCTSRITLRQTINKHIYDEREKDYITLFDLVQTIRDQPHYVYNYDKVVKPLNNLRTRINLYASKELIDALEPFYVEMKGIFEQYADKFESEESLSRNEARLEAGDVTEVELENEKRRYEDSHLPEMSHIIDVQERLITIMRADLKLEK